jgi:hypothetical protein
LPLPQSIPKGILIVLGTQKLKLVGMPPDVESEASLHGRSIQVELLRREAVFELVEQAKLEVDRYAATFLTGLEAIPFPFVSAGPHRHRPVPRRKVA